MRKKWRLQRGPDTVVIVRRVDLFPEDYIHAALHVSAGDIDRWLTDLCARPVAIEMFEAIHGRALSDLRQASVDALRRSVKPWLEQAFQRGDLVAVPATPVDLTQSPMEEAEEAKPPAAPPARPPATARKTWIEIELVDEQGKPVPKQRYRIELPDGSFRDGVLDSSGRVRFDGLEPGQCEICFPEIDANEWQAA
jgi:hypothetical protein